MWPGIPGRYTLYSAGRVTCIRTFFDEAIALVGGSQDPEREDVLEERWAWGGIVGLRSPSCAMRSRPIRRRLAAVTHARRAAMTGFASRTSEVGQMHRQDRQELLIAMYVLATCVALCTDS